MKNCGTWGGLLGVLLAGCQVHATGSAKLNSSTGVQASANADVTTGSAGPAGAAAPIANDRPKSRTLLALDIDFEFDHAKLIDSDRKTLADNMGAICLLVKEHQRLTIEGHADSRGPDDHNLQLSQERAAAVREAILANKRCSIAASQLVAVGFGEKEPRRCHELPECDSKDHGPKTCENCWNENRMTILSVPEETTATGAPSAPAAAPPAAQGQSGCSRVLVLGEERGSRMCEQGKGS